MPRRGIWHRPPQPTQPRPSVVPLDEGAPATIAPAGLASVTVAALDPGKTVQPNADLAAVTVAALQPTAAGATIANAGLAAVTVTALAPAAEVRPNAGLAAITVATLGPGKTVAPSAGLAAVTVATYPPTFITSTTLALPIGLGGGVDYIDRIKVGTLVIKTNADRRDSTMDVTLIGTAGQLFDPGVGGSYNDTPQADNPIEFRQGSTILFDGIIRSVRPRDLVVGASGSGGLELALACQDWTSAYRTTICDPAIGSFVRTTVESDKARIQWVLDTVLGAGLVAVTGVAVVSAMPTQDFTGMSLAEAIADVCRISGADWYVVVGTHGEQLRYTSVGVVRALTSPFGVAATDTLTATNHGLSANDRIVLTAKSGGAGLALNTPYWVIAGGLTANNFKVSTTQGGSAVDFTTDLTQGSWMLMASAAPYDLSDAPNGSTSTGYQDLTIPEDSTERRESVVVIGGGGFHETVPIGAGYPQYETVDFGARTGVIKDSSITTSADAQQAAAAFFAEHGAHRTEGNLTTFQAGIEPGMDVRVYSDNQLWNQHALDGTIDSHPGSPQTYRVAGVTIVYPRAGDLRWRISFGSLPRLLHHAIYDIAHPREIAADVVAGVLKGYIGEIVGFAIATPPTGFLLCNGAAVSRTTYAALFGVIGTTFGAGDGTTTFNVPDLRGRFPLGVDGTHALASTGGAIDHSHAGPSHTHTGPSHSHTQPTHTHPGPSHTHTGPSHSHSHSHAGPSHTHTGPSHTHAHAATHQHELPLQIPVSGSTAIRGTRGLFGTGGAVAWGYEIAGAVVSSANNAAELSEAVAPGTSDSGGTAATGSGGTGATDTDATAGGTGATGSGGTGLTGADGNDATGADGTAATGASGTGATGTGNPPYIAIHYVIRYA